MSKKNAASSTEDARGREPNLNGQYGDIGISAVAAALQFRSQVKNPAYAPVAPRLSKWLADAAA